MPSYRHYPAVQTGRVLILSLLVALLINLTGCTRDSDDNLPTLQNVNERVVGNDQLTLLEAAVTRANLGSALSGSGPLTVFAPTDAAFRAAGFADAAAINAAPVATLSNILLYHVVSGTAVASAAIPTAQTAYPTSVSSNAPVYVTKTSAGATSVNGARVAQADVQASNGIIHVIDQVLMPPMGSILNVVQADTSLSLLTTAALRGGPLVTGALSGTTTALTVFAPTNAAFRAAGFPNAAAINAASEAVLTRVLTNHVVANARAFSPTIASGPITTFGGGSVTANVVATNGITLSSPGSGTVVTAEVLSNAANLRQRDINATNGVIHKINRVLLP